MLNGPPRVGKDAAAAYLEQHYSFRHYKFAAPLYEAVPALCQLSTKEWDYLNRCHKEAPNTALMGMSPREAMIWISEGVMKPKCGTNIFGILALRHLLTDNPMRVVFSDCGFNEECQVLLNMFGSKQIELVHLNRPGCNFSNDSRHHVDLGIPAHQISNNGTLDLLYQRLDYVVAQFESEQQAAG